MNIKNQYIIQAIILAANNLRLSSEKIEIISLLKEHLSKSEDVSEEISKMKKMTELSKFGIKLGQLYSYISSSTVDFLKITDNFKEQSHMLVIELSNLLDSVTPSRFREIISEIKEEESSIDVHFKKTNTEILETTEIEKINFDDELRKNEQLKKEIVYSENEDEKTEFEFEEFEKKVVDSIKTIDVLLRKIESMDFTKEDLEAGRELISENKTLSYRIGLEIITEMHTAVESAFNFIILGKLLPNENVIENIRACLVVIVAVVRNKDVDISNYLKRANHFTKELEKID
ncbi:MAG: hypothetical protein GXO87_03435 [Chlorobi bacterium]|nr:hypothetical protein [Chlorobiota bacterium]